MAKGYTQENLALDAEISRSHLANIKGATNSPSLEMVDKISKVLGVESWQLLLPNLEVESLEPDAGSVSEFTAPATLKIVRDQDSKRKLRSSDL
ncbi:MAG: helix-turn-helix domain-containing protein [Sphingopyxis sp.]